MRNQLPQFQIRKKNFFERAGVALKGAFFPGSSGSRFQLAFPTSVRDVYEASPYHLNSAVIAALSWKQRNFSEAYMEIIRKDDNAAATEPRAQKALNLINRPNPYWTRKEMNDAITYSLDFFGNCFLYKARISDKEHPDFGKPARLWFLPPQYVKIMFNSDGNEFISHYEYRPHTQTFKYVPEDIIHFRTGLNPDDYRLGLASLESARREIGTDNESITYRWAILRNLGIIGAIISPKDANVTFDDETKEELESWYMSKTTGDNRGKPLLLSGGVQVDKAAMSPNDMGLDSFNDLSEDRISAAIGINPMVTGLTSGKGSSSFSNFKEAHAAAYETNLIPTQSYIAEKLNYDLLPDFGLDEHFYFKWNYSRVRALMEDENKRVFRIIAMFKAGLIERDEARAQIGGMKPLGGTLGKVLVDPTKLSGRADANIASPVNNTDPTLERPAGGNGKSQPIPLDDRVPLGLGR